jgi:hypothetical protein
MAPRKVDGLDGNFHQGAKIVLLYPMAVIAKKAFVAIDIGTTTNGVMQHVQEALNTNVDGSTMCCGVALDAAAAASTINPIRVQVAGRVTGAEVASTVIAGDMLIASASAGSCYEVDVLLTGSYVEANQVAAASAAKVGIALTNASTLTADVFLLDPMNLAD